MLAPSLNLAFVCVCMCVCVCASVCHGAGAPAYYLKYNGVPCAVMRGQPETLMPSSVLTST